MFDLTKSTNYVVFDVEGAKSNQVCIVGTYDEPWFCGADVCKILEYKDIKCALRDNVMSDFKTSLLELSEKFLGDNSPNIWGGSLPPHILGASNLSVKYPQCQMVYVNEPGLYSLILKSKAPLALQFQKFICTEVLPAIRKHGAYVQSSQLAIEFEEKLRLKDTETKQLIEAKNKELEEQARYLLVLQDLCIDNTKRESTQLLYIASSRAYSQQNRFKVGGVESESNLKSRLSQYNSGAANGDDFHFIEWYNVPNFKVMEKKARRYNWSLS